MKPIAKAISRRAADMSARLLDSAGFVKRLNQLPLEIPPDVTVTYLGRDSSGRAVLLCPVNKLNNLPKHFRFRVQGVMPLWEPRGEQVVLVRSDGTCYAVIHNKPHDL